MSLQALRCSWHETRTSCTWKHSRGTRLHRLRFSNCLLSFSPAGGRFLWCGAKIQVASSTVLASSQCCCLLVHARRAAASTAGQAAASTAGQAAAEQRAAAVACSSSSGSSVRQAPNGKIKVRAGSISIQIQQQLRAANSSSGERRAAAATESSLVQARKSGLIKANIDPQPPSTVNGCASGQSTAAGNDHCKTSATQMRGD